MSTPQEQKVFETAITALPVQTLVRGNDALAAALGHTRKRDMSIIGTVIDYDRVRLRVGVNWADDRNIEYLAPKYLVPVEGK